MSSHRVTTQMTQSRRRAFDASRHPSDSSDTSACLAADVRSNPARSVFDIWFLRGFRELACPRSWLLAFTHGVVFAGVFWFAYLLRFDFDIPEKDLRVISAALIWVIGLKLLVFCLLSQFHGWWRYVTFADLTSLLRAVVVSLCVLAAANFFTRLPIPREACSSSTPS